jgi:hypothetical protein
MKRATSSALIGLPFALALGAATPAMAGQLSPIFAGTNATVLSQTQAKNVVGKNTTSFIYGYYGNLYAAYAIQWASYSMIYDGLGYSGAYTYYGYAASLAQYAVNYYTAAGNIKASGG